MCMDLFNSNKYTCIEYVHIFVYVCVCVQMYVYMYTSYQSIMGASRCQRSLVCAVTLAAHKSIARGSKIGFPFFIRGSCLIRDLMISTS